MPETPIVNHDTIYYCRGVWLRTERTTGKILLDIPDGNREPSTTNIEIDPSIVKLLREAFSTAAEDHK